MQKKLLDLTVFFALLGSVSVKAALKMLVKLTQELQVITLLSLCSKLTYFEVKVQFVKINKTSFYEIIALKAQSVT